MQTQLLKSIQQTAVGQEAEAILRSCVHCGFCTATCPTYQLLGDELDSPRGRIYLIKQVLEGEVMTRQTQLHLDRCLTCRACETTCPSSVQYGRLLDIGRQQVEQHISRPYLQRLIRSALLFIVPYPARFRPLLKIAQPLRRFLPLSLRQKVPQLPAGQALRSVQSFARPLSSTPSRTLLALTGCVQSVVTPETHQAAVQVLAALGMTLITRPQASCCGAMSQHLSATAQARQFMRNNIDAWTADLSRVEAIISTASGCGVMLKDYGHLLQGDTIYAQRAQQVSALAKDLVEILAALPDADLAPFRHEKKPPLRLAVHSPCTLQHGQQLPGQLEALLARLGYEVVPVADSHLCCGSAGTYSILQPRLSNQLLQQKLHALQSSQPDLIVTANIGCQLHLAAQATVPVRHWLSLLAAACTTK